MRTLRMQKRRSHTGREFALLFGGIATGVAGSRLLPPLLAAIMGRLRAGQDAFDRLITDHRQILSVLNEMVAAPAGSTVNRSRMFLTLKRKLAKHTLAEEDVVYPLLHGPAARTEESKHLYDEHADMKILLYELGEALKSGTDWSVQASSLRDLIRRHVDEEERTVFPQLRNVLSQSRLPALAGQIRREEALIM